MAQSAENAKKAEKTYRVPSAVRESVKSALSSRKIDHPIDFYFASQLASGNSVNAEAITWVKTYFNAQEEKSSVFGGEAGKAWASKFNDVALVSAGFTPEDDLDYYAVGEFEDDPTKVNALVAVDEEDNLLTWADGDWFPLPDTLDDYDKPSIIEISDEDAVALAAWLDVPEKDEEFFILTDIDPDERNLIELAYSEIDWEEIDKLQALTADAAGYSPAERSENASRQIRAGDGKFGGAQAPKGQTLTSLAKARLGVPLALVLDPAARIAEYIASVGAPEAAPDAVVAAADPEVVEEEVVVAEESSSSVTPLYFAIVDPVDTTAVLDTVSIVPGEDGQVTAWKRSEGTWVSSPDLLLDLQGATPPPVVELEDEETIKTVLAQIDAYDNETQSVEEDAPDASKAFSAYSNEDRELLAKKRLALPDGSFAIQTVDDLKEAITASAGAPEDAQDVVQAHIKKRARALNRNDLVPSAWKEASVFNTDHLSPLYDEFGEIRAMVAAGGGNAETLRKYWSVGKGAAKIRWGTEGDLTRCARQLNKYMPGRSWGYCQNLHQRIFGMSNAKRDKAVGQ